MFIKDIPIHIAGTGPISGSREYSFVVGSALDRLTNLLFFAFLYTAAAVVRPTSDIPTVLKKLLFPL